MKNILLKISSLAFATLLLVGFNSCVKDDFDKPPVANIPIGEVITVTDLVAASTSAPQKVTEDKSIYGVITMGEQNGNLYKEAYMRDATGGIKLSLLSSTSLDVGDSIRVYLKGARFYNDNDQVTIDSLETTYNILKISAGNVVLPLELTIADINTGAYVGQLIKLNGVQFKNGELDKTYADAQALTTQNRALEDCTNETVVRTSGYANFAGDLLPEGNGSLICIASSYRGTSQLYIRDVNEVILTGDRCGDSPGGGPVDPVDAIDEKFDGVIDYTDVNITGWSNLLVSGDRLWQGKTFNSEKYVQASGYNSGLTEMETWLITPPVTNISTKVLSFRSAMAFWEHSTNSPMTVYISTDFVGDNFATATWTELNVTLANQSSSDNAWVSSGEVDLSNYTGNAAFAFKYVGSDSESTSYRLDDIKVDVPGGSGGGGVEPVDEVDENFQSLNEYDEITMTGWTSLHVSGDRNWIAQTFNDEVYAQASGYNSGSSEMEAWMITPPVTNIQDKKLSFKSAIAYWAHGSGHPGAVLVSEDFDGENFETATWTEIDVLLAQEADGDHNWVESGEYDLSAFNGNAAIAFRYIGSDSESTTFRVDDILITDGNGGGGGGTSLPYFEDFTSDLGSFTAFNENGPQEWIWEFYDDGCAKMAGYDNGQIANVDWLISPQLDLTDNAGTTMEFRQAANYVGGEWSYLQVLVSTNYTGTGDPNNAIWTELNVPTWPSGDNWDFLESGVVNLSDYDGENIHIAFKYTSSNSVASTWEIGSVTVE